MKVEAVRRRHCSDGEHDESVSYDLKLSRTLSDEELVQLSKVVHGDYRRFGSKIFIMCKSGRIVGSCQAAEDCTLSCTVSDIAVVLDFLEGL